MRVLRLQVEYMFEKRRSFLMQIYDTYILRLSGHNIGFFNL